MVPALLTSVKKDFPSGIAPKGNGIGTGAQKRQKEFQRKIQDLREVYQRKADLPEGMSVCIGGKWMNNKDIISKKQAIKKMAETDELVRLCWKYISNPVELEGVHVAWKEEPKVIFEPIKETV